MILHIIYLLVSSLPMLLILYIYFIVRASRLCMMREIRVIITEKRYKTQLESGYRSENSF